LLDVTVEIAMCSKPGTTSVSSGGQMQIRCSIGGTSYNIFLSSRFFL